MERSFTPLQLPVWGQWHSGYGPSQIVAFIPNEAWCQGRIYKGEGAVLSRDGSTVLLIIGEAVQMENQRPG